MFVIFFAGYELGIYVAFKQGHGHVVSTKKQICPLGKDCYFEPVEIRQLAYGNWVISLDKENPSRYILISDFNTSINYRIIRAFNEKGLSNVSVSFNNEKYLDMRDTNESGKYDLITYAYKKEIDMLVTSQDVGMNGDIDSKYLLNTSEDSFYDIINEKYIYKK